MGDWFASGGTDLPQSVFLAILGLAIWTAVERIQRARKNAKAERRTIADAALWKSGYIELPGNYASGIGAGISDGGVMVCLAPTHVSALKIISTELREMMSHLGVEEVRNDEWPLAWFFAFGDDLRRLDAAFMADFANRTKDRAISPTVTTRS